MDFYPFREGYPSIQDLLNLFEVSFTIYNFLEQNFDFYNDDEHSHYFNYIGKSLTNLPINAEEDLGIILLFLSYNYIETFIESLNDKLNLNFILPLDFEIIKFREDEKQTIYLIVSNTYFKLLEKLNQAINFNPRHSFPDDFYTSDRLFRYNKFLDQFKVNK